MENLMKIQNWEKKNVLPPTQETWMTLTILLSYIVNLLSNHHHHSCYWFIQSFLLWSNKMVFYISHEKYNYVMHSSKWNGTGEYWFWDTARQMEGERIKKEILHVFYSYIATCISEIFSLFFFFSFILSYFILF